MLSQLEMRQYFFDKYYFLRHESPKIKRLNCRRMYKLKDEKAIKLVSDLKLYPSDKIKALSRKVVIKGY